MTTGRSLPAQLTGRVIHPDSPGYTEARTDWDGLYRSYPLAVVFAKTAEDVVNAITWATPERRRAAGAQRPPQP
jgi:FAD/FMN-containing dehydrogenase